MADRKVVLVSGASRGLGYALALEAARRDGHVLALARSQGALDDLADAVDAQNSGAITIIPGDVTDADAMAYMAQSVFQRFGKLDLWLHTALYTAPMQPVAHMIAKDLNTALAVNVQATAQLIRVLEPLLRNTDKAQAVFFADDHLRQSNMANMRTSKLAQMTLVDAWQKEADAIGPQVRVLVPKPMRGHLRATLYPGENAGELADPKAEAVKILDQLGL